MLDDNIKILFFGDIVGKIGRKAIKKELAGLKEKYQPDLVLANVENLAHGTGITRQTIAEMQEAGIDYFTSGNHIFDKPQAEEFLEEADCPIIRPANFIEKKYGQGTRIIRVNNKNLLLVNLAGRVFMGEEFSCPFKALDRILEKYQNKNLGGILVDFHAEATSEKTALGWYINGRVSALLGTHTHILTGDARILSEGTAYVSDIGMVGAEDSVIGVDKELIIDHFLNASPLRSEIPEKGLVVMNGVLIEIDPQTRKTIKIERVDLKTEV